MLKVMTVALLAFSTSYATVNCPPNEQGQVLTCAIACCKRSDRAVEDYFCCELADNQVVHKTSPENGRPHRLVAYSSIFQIDYTLLIIGLIISIVLSVLCSLFCCLLCNGCWLHRRRNPELYESVNETGFYPLCCGFGIPMGTIVFSTHPPQFRDGSEIYPGSSTTSYSSRGRVRFTKDDTSRGGLKNNVNAYPGS